MQYAAVFPDPVRALARISLFSSASGIDLACIRVGWANPMSAKARKTRASSKCEKEPKVVLVSTRVSSAIFSGGMLALWREEGAKLQETRGGEGSMKTVSEISEANFVLDHSHCDKHLLQICTLTLGCISVRREASLSRAHISAFWSLSMFFPSDLSWQTMPYPGLGFRTGKLEGSTANFDEEHAAELLKSGPIRFSAVDAGFEHFVTVGEDKKLKVWELDGPKLRSQRSAVASFLRLATDFDLHTTYQGSSKTAHFIEPHEERSYNHRL
jgi:hypothetical protein